MNGLAIKDYHRDLVARYYRELIRRHGLYAWQRRVGTLRRIVWTAEGFALVERRMIG